LSCDEVTFMGILVKQVTLRGDKGQVELDGMFDTGATYSVIRKDIAEQIATVIPLDEPIALRTAEQGRQLTVTHRVVLTIWLNGYRLSDEFLVLEELSRPVLIGAATMQKWRIRLDMANEEVIVDPTATELWLL
jgi:predicted aspartyl protease